MATSCHRQLFVSQDEAMPSSPKLDLHPDRLLPTDPGVRAVASDLYAHVAGLPIISPHGHVPAQWLAQDIPFSDPTSLLITPDHYVNRMLHAHGVELSALGVGQGALTDRESREAFRIVCSQWSAFRGTPVRFWFDAQLREIFGVTTRPSAETADQIYDQIADRLASPESSRGRSSPSSTLRCWPPPTTRVTTSRPISSCGTTTPGRAG